VSIEIENLYKEYQKKREAVIALDNISLNVREGEFIGLLGPKDSGKTTLLKILATLLTPSSGEAYLNDISIKDKKQIRKIVGFVFTDTYERRIFDRLSIFQYLILHAIRSGLQKTTAKHRIHELLNFFNLYEKRNTQVKKLPTGLKSVILIMRSLIPFPQILLLDEPMLGLESESSEEEKNLLKDGLLQSVATQELTTVLNSFEFSEKKGGLLWKFSIVMKTIALLIRSLVPFPKVLLPDETPLRFFSATNERIKDLLLEFNREFGTTILLTSQNYQDLDEFTSRLILIDQGEVIQDCKPQLFKKTAAKECVNLIFSLPPSPSSVFGMSGLPPDVFKQIVRDSAGAEIVSLTEKDSANFIYEATIRPKQFSLNDTISRLTVLILRASGEIFKIVPYMPSLKESFLAFLEYNRQKTEGLSERDFFGDDEGGEPGAPLPKISGDPPDSPATLNRKLKKSSNKDDGL